MQPSQQMWRNARVGWPSAPRSQKPASCTMSSLPFGSVARQCRPVLSCDPMPFTVASFCATWKSTVHGRSASVIVRSADSSTARLSQSKFSGRMRSSGALVPSV